jgi:hypothetical protein
MEVIFPKDGRLAMIAGFQRCTSLSRVSFPASVEVIDATGFWGCSGLTEVIFATRGRLRRINGFQECTSLSRIRIPA